MRVVFNEDFINPHPDLLPSKGEGKNLGIIVLKKAKNLLSHFGVGEQVVSAEPYGSGHVNKSYVVATQNGTGKRYLLQSISRYVFHDIPALMDNIARVTDHIRRKSEIDKHQHILTLLYAANRPYYQDDAGEYWRLFYFIDGAKTYDQVTSVSQAFEGGRAFGEFLKLVSDLPAPPLHETIPNFHNIDIRLGQLTKALDQDPLKRAKHVQENLRFIREHAGQMRFLEELKASKQIPVRVTHNDTKFNNVLLDQHGKAICVIDLDTVMPGIVHYDYADSLRTVANTAAEDASNLNDIGINIEFFKSFSQGFISEIKATLTKAEHDTLIPALPVMPFMLALRFLTDYLLGDHYFKPHFPEHNLQRAKAQLQLSSRFMEQQSDLQKCFKDVD